MAAMNTPWLAEAAPIVTPAVLPGVPSGRTFAQGGILNPFDGYALIDEIRFFIRGLSVPAQSYQNKPQTLASRVTMRLGRTPILDDVPIEAFCKTLDAYASTRAGNTYFTAGYVWRLPRPLIMPKGARLEVGVNYWDIMAANAAAPGVLTVSATHTVAVAGRPYTGVVPVEVDVPYACHWTPTPLVPTATDGTGYVSASSSRSDLVNPFGVPLAVREIVGRLRGDLNVGGVNNVMDMKGAAANAQLRLYGANGLLGVRDQTPFGALIYTGRNAWNVNAQIEPRGYYMADFEYRNVTFGMQSVGLTVGIVGTRKVIRAALEG